MARDAADKAGIPLQEGVYCYCTGPQFETPAEIRAFRILGGDAAGMSTVTEALTEYVAIDFTLASLVFYTCAAQN